MKMGVNTPEIGSPGEFLETASSSGKMETGLLGISIMGSNRGRGNFFMGMAIAILGYGQMMRRVEVAFTHGPMEIGIKATGMGTGKMG